MAKNPQNGKFWTFGPIFEGVPDFSGTCCLLQICRYWSELTFCTILAKSQDSNLSKWLKTLKNGHFDPKRAKMAKLRFFSKNPAVSLFLLYCPLTSCKKSEKSQEPFPRKTGYQLLLPSNGSDFMGPGESPHRSKIKKIVGAVFEKNW